MEKAYDVSKTQKINYD